jgi:glycosyltransferase involved in cell wall biosynthesis
MAQSRRQTPRLRCSDRVGGGHHISTAAVKLVSILGSPAPYTTPILNALATRLDLHCIYLAGEDRVSRFVDTWGVEPEYDYSVHWARRLDVPSVDLHLEISVGTARRLRRLKPDAILLVSWNPAGLEPLLWSRWSGSAAVMWSESTRFSGLLREPVSARLRQLLARVFDSYVANGSQATEYLEELGVRRERIVTSSLPAGRVPATTARANPVAAGELRFLFVGRLLPQKRPVELIEAFTAVRAIAPNATLTIVGTGELESDVREAARRASGVSYVGYREGAELASIYAESDVLVLPALREVWGVVVNEALSHGLFVVTTDQVGSAYDLLDDESGLVFPAEDLTALAPALVEAATKLDASDAAREHRARAVATSTPARFADDIAHAAEVAVHVRATRWRGQR